MLLTAVFAAGALFIRFELSSMRAGVREQLEGRLGGALAMGAITVNGFHGLRIEGLELTAEPEGRPRFEFSAPEALVNINLNNLLYGNVTLERVLLDGCRIRAIRQKDAHWFDAGNFGLEDLLPFDRAESFRITGQNSTIEIQNVVGDTDLLIEEVQFDVTRLVDSPDLIARMEGALDGDAEKSVSLRLAFASFEDFELKIDSAMIDAGDANVFLPAEHRFVSQGLARPTLLVNGRTGKTVGLSLEAEFNDLVIRNQPTFLPPATGMLIAHASYSTVTRRLEFTHTRASSRELAGDVEGSVSFDGPYPEFDIRLVADRLPARQLLDSAFGGQFDFSGEALLELNEPHEVVLAFNGTTDDPVITGSAQAGSGRLEYNPKDKNQLRLALELGQLEGNWNPDSEDLSIRIKIQNGEAVHEGMGLRAEALTGVISLENGVLYADDPITGTLTGNPFIAGLDYNVAEDFGEFSFNGVLSHIEDLPVATRIPLTELSGSLSLTDFELTKSGDTYTAEGAIDATQARLDHAWWLSKREGIGATAQLSVDFQPNARARIKATQMKFASSQFSGDMAFSYAPGQSDSGWAMDQANAQSDMFDVTALGPCLRIPYRITGGTGRAGRFEWRRDSESRGGWSQTLSAFIDEIQLLPLEEGAKTPLLCREVEARAVMTRGEHSTGSLDLYAEESQMPSFRETWFLPFDRRNARGVQMPFIERSWSFDLESNDLNLPPWSGQNFRATAYLDTVNAGVNAYSASIEEGQISGSYHAVKAEHAFESNVEWQSVPSRYFIEHLDFPEIFSGVMTGNVSYTLDRDDPGTLKGSGSFGVTDGQFSADFLYSLLEEQLEDEALALPTSLKYSLLDVRDLEFEGDLVCTPSFALDADGIRIEGSGHYIRDGDMDYTLQVGIAPAVAEEIPVFRDNFDIQGLKLAQKNLDLAFKLQGPTFNPQGRVSDLPPAGTMLISATLGVTGRILKTPGKLLFDLIKSAGAIMGAAAH